MNGMSVSGQPTDAPPIVKKRLPNGLEVYQNNEGETSFLYDEIFRKEMYFRHGIALEDNSTVLDVGANIGMFTLFVNSKSAGCRVYAFEPLPPTYEILKLNTSALPGVTIVNCGLSDENKEAAFAYFPTMSTDSVQLKYREDHDKDLRFGLLNHYRDDFANERSLNRFVDHVMTPRMMKEQVYRCQLTTIADIMRRYELTQVDLLKIDVEKSEFEVLEGIGRDDWTRIRQVVMEVHNLDDAQLRRLRQVFEDQGFSVVIDAYDDLNIPDYYNVYAINRSFAS
ncbi:hypothetical protein PA598K_04151 [Paenibacillus sp. 598K]|nr:hypothetical protein PA598K_04151 [Paenibacillus sp. 598K]